MQNENNILRGWKEIEKYLRIGRNAIRSNNYPIRFEDNGSVYALKSELDAFLLREKIQYHQID